MKIISRKKIVTVLMNVIRSWAFPIGQLILAKQVINLDASLWGQTVGVLIYLQLFSLVSVWGNNEYVLRESSLNPSGLNKIWNDSFYSRLPLLIGSIILCFFLFSHTFILVIGLWLIAQYIISSVEGLILFQNKIKQIAITELGLVIFLLAFLFSPLKLVDSLTSVLWLLAIWQVLRAVVRIIIFSKTIRLEPLKLSKKYYSNALTFMLIALFGMLFSKIDIYVANRYLEDELLGKYQLFVSCFIYLQSIAALILMPFVKQVYRFTLSRIKKMIWIYSGIGIVFIIFTVPLINLFLVKFYFIDFEWINYIIESLIIQAMFFSLPIIIYLKGKKKEKYILAISIVGALINLSSSLILYPIYGFTGFILATAGSQCLGAIGYYTLLNRENSNTIKV